MLVSKLRALLQESGIDGVEALTSAFGCYQLTLPSDTWIDVVAAAEAADAAERALAAGAVERARVEASTAESLARRTFLPGEEGRWIAEQRDQLRETLVRALDCLAEVSLRTSEPATAARIAEEIVGLEPFRERGYRLLMQAQSAAGNDAEALRTYERCRRLLAEELGSYPSAETEAIYRRLLDPRPAAAPPFVEAPPSAVSSVGFETAEATSTSSGDRGFRRRDRAARRRGHPRRRDHRWIRRALGRAELDRRPRRIRLDRGDRSRRRAADRDHVGRGRTVGRESRRPDRDTGRRVVSTSRAAHRSRRPTDRTRRDERHGMGGRRQRQRLEDRPEVRPAGRHTPTRGPPSASSGERLDQRSQRSGRSG